MGKQLIASVVMFFLGSFSSAQVPEQSTSPKMEIGFANENWSLVFDAVGFRVKTNALQPDGRAYLLAANESTQVTLSVYLQKVPGEATADDCRENQKKRLRQKVDYEREKIESRELAGMAIVEYTIPHLGDVPVQQRNLFACLAKDDVYVDIHLSKTLFKPEDEELLNTVLTSAHLVDRNSSNLHGVEPSAPENMAPPDLEYFREGNRYFVQQDFSASIAPYQKALEAEKQSRKLPKNYWRVLVDNLGMAYGITGKLDQAEETFKYGLSLDPTYPMFYYNLACSSAERHNMEKTIELLRTAFSYKANVIPNEAMPDPREDESFKPFMADPRFRDFLNSL